MINKQDLGKIIDDILGDKKADVAVRSYNEPVKNVVDLKSIDPGKTAITSVPKETTVEPNRDLARLIDHTLLKPEVSQHELNVLCEEAKEYEFASVCVNSVNVKYCKDKLKGSRVALASVIGFPLGAMPTEIKRKEAAKAIADGADELDMVINVGWLKSGMFEEVYKDILAVVQAAHGKVVKVILETYLLTDEEKVKACVLSKDAGASFVKTSTGFNKGGATVEDVALMRKVVGPRLGVKASGGVRNYDDAMRMIKAGANRLGASSSIAIVTGGEASGDY